MKNASLIITTAIVTIILISCVIVINVFISSLPGESTYQNSKVMARGSWPEITMQELYLQENKLVGLFILNSDSASWDISQADVSFYYNGNTGEGTQVSVVSSGVGNYNGTKFVNCSQSIDRHTFGIDNVQKTNLTFQAGEVVRFCVSLDETLVPKTAYRLYLTPLSGRPFIYDGTLPSDVSGKVILSTIENK